MWITYESQRITQNREGDVEPAANLTEPGITIIITLCVKGGTYDRHPCFAAWSTGKKTG
jgi:hypothetical protein